MITVSSLYIYPVKSLAGISLQETELSQLGLKHDRRWMIVDEKGQFLSQRQVAKMALIKTSIHLGQLRLSFSGEDCNVPAVDEYSAPMKVTVWKDTFEALLVSKEVDAWLSSVLQRSCHLVYMPESVNRQIDRDYAPRGQNVSFADGFPLLLISQASLDDLNARLTHSIRMDRFRPNVVVSGTEAFAEDHWQSLSIGATEFLAVKRCSRCVIPSINQQTAEKDQNAMLKILRTFRLQNNKIMFGNNLIYKNLKNIKDQKIICGDEVKLN